MRVVVKVGTAVLTGDDGGLDVDRIRILADQLALLPDEVLLVTSGAIAAGWRRLGFAQRPLDLADLQASAAVGQGILMEAYHRAFAGRREVAQILLTSDDFSDRRRYLNLRNTIQSLLERKAIPIINENDTVSVREIEGVFSDNDALSALLASGIEADELVILTSVDGVFDRDPGKPGAQLIREVPEVTDALLAAAAKGRSKGGRGGMQAKLLAARMASLSGTRVVIANGRGASAIADARAGRIGTLFLPQRRLSARKRWIAFASLPKGTILVNPGAVEALVSKGGNLLAAGVVGLRGDFDQGDIVLLAPAADPDHPFAKGITHFGSADLTRVAGRNGGILEEQFGITHREVVRRDNLVFLGREGGGDDGPGGNGPAGA